MKDEITTIQLKKSVVKALREIKKYPGETYNEIILDLIKDAYEAQELNTFIQKAQESKMKELWEDGYYRGWKNV